MMCDVHQLFFRMWFSKFDAISIYNLSNGRYIMEEKQYRSPALSVLELYPEGVLCSSTGTESLDENEGIW